MIVVNRLGAVGDPCTAGTIYNPLLKRCEPGTCPHGQEFDSTGRCGPIVPPPDCPAVCTGGKTCRLPPPDCPTLPSCPVCSDCPTLPSCPTCETCQVCQVCPEVVAEDKTKLPWWWLLVAVGAGLVIGRASKSGKPPIPA